MEVTSEQMERVSEKLRGLPEYKMTAALTNAANRGLSSASGVAWTAVHSMYTVKKAAFYKNLKKTVVWATESSLAASVNFNGYVIPLIQFRAKQGARSHRKEMARWIDTEVLAGVPKNLKHAYITDLGKYGENVFERLSSRRNDSQTLYGPSAAHMVYNAEVLKEMDEAAKATFDKRLDHEIDRILRGLGGK